MRTESLRVVVGVFAAEGELVAAADAARRGGLPIHDAYSPYAVHGLDRAMGLPASALPKICFRLGAAGLAIAAGFEYWASTYDWPMNIGGKSISASPALAPIAFELTVLFAAVGSVLAFLYIRRLSPLRVPELPALGALNDRFVLALRAEPGGASRLKDFLREHGAATVEEAELR